MVMLRPVSEMKGSGIEWVGPIPEYWKVVKNNRLFRITKTLVGDEWENTQLLSLTKGGIIEKDINDGGGKQPESFSTYQFVQKDDIVLCLFDIDVSAVFSDRSPFDGMISPAYRVMKCTKNILPVYAKWWFDAVNVGRYYLIYTKSLRKTIDSEGFGNILTAVPPLSEQQAIASYLDERCSKLDEIIAEAEKSIEEYKELKQAVLFETVTKGLDKNVPMKDSGIKWIGDIPSHWLVKKFKYVASVNANLVSPDDYMDYQQIAPDCIEKDSGRLIKERTVSEAGVESWNQLFHKGQLIYSKIRPILNKVIIAPYDGLCSADMYPLDVVEDIEFVQKAMLSRYFVDQVGLITQDRVKMPKINKEELANIIMAIPPREEQIQIVKDLHGRMAEIDEVIDEKQALIDDLQAYKKSLIYEVVTGKRRVV